jgi:hypothetical protein
MRSCRNAEPAGDAMPKSGSRQSARPSDRDAGAYVCCSNQGTGTVLYGDSPNWDPVTVITSPNQEVVCDWYYIL